MLLTRCLHIANFGSIQGISFHQSSHIPFKRAISPVVGFDVRETADVQVFECITGGETDRC
jgi:hypothetical protein